MCILIRTRTSAFGRSSPTRSFRSSPAPRAIQDPDIHGRKHVAAIAGNGSRHERIGADYVFVCLAGQLRTFLQPTVQKAFASHVHRPGYEYVLSTDTARPSHADHVLLIRPILSWITLVESDPTADEGDPKKLELLLRQRRCAPPSCNPYNNPRMNDFAAKVAACHAPMLREEAARGIEYSYVLRLRPDHMFLTPLAHPRDLLARKPRGRVLLWDDQVSVTRRRFAAVVHLAPRSVYAACLSPAVWELGCVKLARPAPEHADQRWMNQRMRECTQEGAQPCETMNLIATFAHFSNGTDVGSYTGGVSGVGGIGGVSGIGGVGIVGGVGGSRASKTAMPVITHERLALTHRAWKSGHQEPVDSGDFCIKRVRYLVDDPENDCRNNGGCMDC